jgi:DNA-binding winged helix-turn-helix (wHTH) protein
MTRKSLLIDELKVRRQTLGWSLQELGERCAIDKLFLREWEAGIGSPRLEAVDAWAAALGLKLGLASTESAARAGVSVDWQRRSAAIDGSPVRLTPMEWKALERLAANPGEVVSHLALFRHLYGDNRPYESRSTAIRVLITKLRRLLPLRIEAQWGRGYVINGIASSRPGDDAENAHGADEVAVPPVPQSERAVTVPYPMRTHNPLLRPVEDHAGAPAGLPEGPAVRVGGQRTEELRVIERFLTERGVTRCPDVATIAQSPLPTLVWDKVKRKWVRPGIASARQAV